MKSINQIIEELKNIPKIEKNKGLFFDCYAQLGKIGVIEYYFHPEKAIFRSRINKCEPSFLSIDEISYPQNPSKNYGRANMPGKTMFYGSFIPDKTADDEIKEAYVINAYEISPFMRNTESRGETKITIGMWKVKCDIKLLIIPFYQKFVSKTALSHNLNSEFKGVLSKNSEYKELTEIWNNFISQEFARPVEENSSSEYMISATYSEFLLNKGYDGIIFPTVQLNGRGFNFAIKTDIIDKCTEIKVVSEARIYKNKLRTIMDWEKLCIVEDPKNFKFKDDSEKIGKERCLKIINMP